MTSKFKKKILICYVEFHHYRIPIFERLSETYDITIVHSSEQQTDGNACFTEISIPARKIWRFRFQPGLLRIVLEGGFDAVIFLFDLAWISTVLSFLLCPSSVRRVTWGFWLTKSTIANKLRVFFAKRADANVFYATGAGKDFLMMGIPQEKIWIARNTGESFSS